MVRRETAKLKEVKDLFKGEYKQSTDINNPHRIETNSDTFSRVNILATVEDRYMNPDESYGSIQVTDNTATIRIKLFQEDTYYLEGIEKGDLVKVIGKVREDEDGRFILGEIIKKIQDPKYAELRKLDKEIIEKNFTDKKQQETQPKENQEEPSNELNIEETEVEG